MQLGKTIKELCETMTTKEFYMWAKYYQETYFLKFADDLRHAVTNRNLLMPWTKKGATPNYADYMCFPDEPVYPTTTELIYKCHGLIGAL